MDSFHQLMTELRGGITPQEGSLLRRLASACRDGCIVEVGSFRGKSAIALAFGVRDIEAPAARPEIYCIEPHRPFTGFYGGEFGPADRGAFYAAMGATEAFREVALVNLSSEEITPSWTRQVGLLFIDGDHHYPGVKRDFDCWDPHVPQGGIVAFDDAKDPACGPHRLVHEILTGGRYDLVERTGKIVVLRKLEPAGHQKGAGAHRRILIACDRVVAAGGLFRFDRAGRVLQEWGHEVAFVSLSDRREADFDTALPVLTFGEAAARTWDAVMVPGAGFPEPIIRRFSELRHPRFGVRIQHVLNDQSRRAAFQEVNAQLAPHVVVFNNLAWPAGSYTEFSGDRFHVLLGAVDSRRFRPAPYRAHPLTAGRWVVGGLANKNPESLVEALQLLPEDVTLRLFGHDTSGLAGRHADLMAAGRLQLAGPIGTDDLAEFYRRVDCVVSAETFAGWANLAAEAMASGVPVVCTRPGTEAFAEHLETALVVEQPAPRDLADAILRLRNDAALCSALADEGRRRIEEWPWERYARDLLQHCAHDGKHHYASCPELGLFGKWPIAERLQGLDPVLDAAAGCSIIDFGAAEGLVGRELLMRGASLVHGFELDPARVADARRLCAGFPGAQFRVADLSSWDSFHPAHRDLLQDRYDIVLYLGIHHHLPPGGRMAVLREAARMASRYFAVRMPDRCFTEDGVDAELKAAGLVRLGGDAGPADRHLGSVHIYRREAATH
ncbi:MAG: hypothetical protein K0R58_2350 [Ramlibacter sp.]|jgi:glycosyltransferase involved in cell wall biosynthesis|nr:hypothetical protein [Ramlibacter sp.]